MWMWEFWSRKPKKKKPKALLIYDVNVGWVEYFDTLATISPLLSLGELCLFLCYLVDNHWIFCPSTLLKAQLFIHSICFPPSILSFQWLQHQTTRASFSHYSWLRCEQDSLKTHTKRDFLLASSTKAFCHLRPDHFLCMCICMKMCMCSILFQRIRDSITEPIKDHLFQCANLIRPCSDFDAISSRVTFFGGPPHFSLCGKNRA